MTNYTLSEICKLISVCIKEFAYDSFWVTAEINSISTRGGHCYMELIEKQNGTDNITAKMRAICWANTYYSLSHYFQQQTGKSLAVGMKILVEVTINFHPIYGLSLQIENINPEYTIGNLALTKQLTLQQLEKEGYIGLQQKLSLPTLLRRIAVISSSEAAGYGDFINQLELNTEGFRFQTQLFQATMQGEKAEQSIISQLHKIQNDKSNFDCIIIIRGGGASSDLLCFDNYSLAKEIAVCPIPVLTGIGHFRDETIADKVSFLSLKTPTAVAEFIIAKHTEQLTIIKEISHLLSISIVNHFNYIKDLLTQHITMLDNANTNFLQKKKHELTLLENTLELTSPQKIFEKGYSLATYNGKTIHSIDELNVGNKIKTEFIDGVVYSTIDKLQKH